jgi:hypothetical protein
MKNLFKSLFIVFFASHFIVAEHSPYKEEEATNDLYHKKLTYFALGFKNWKVKSIFDDQTEQELEVHRLIIGSKATKPIFKPATHTGYFGLFYLMQPINDVQTLLKRQSFIKELVNDQQLCIRLEKLLEVAAQHEQELLSYWNPNESLTQRAESLYFSQPKTFFWLFDLPQFTKILNNFALCLEGSIVKEIGKRASILCGLLGAKVIFDDIVGSLVEQRKSSLTRGIKNELSDFVYKHNPFAYNQRLDEIYLAPNEQKSAGRT